MNRADLAKLLLEKAALAFAPDGRGGYARLRHPMLEPRFSFIEAFETADALSRQGVGRRVESHCHRLFRAGGLVAEFDRAARFVTSRGYSRFIYLDHGGVASAFRARHDVTGRIDVVRVEALHEGRPQCIRPRAPACIAQPFHSTEREASDLTLLKIEIMPELAPLNAIFGKWLDSWAPNIMPVDPRHVENVNPLVVTLAGVFYRPLLEKKGMRDRDAMSTNLALTPCGRIQSIDPEIVGPAP